MRKAVLGVTLALGVGDHLFEPAIFILEPPLPTQLGHAQARVAFRPRVDGRFADTELAADLAGGRALHGLAQGQGELRVNRGFFIAVLPSR